MDTIKQAMWAMILFGFWLASNPHQAFAQNPLPEKPSYSQRDPDNRLRDFTDDLDEWDRKFLRALKDPLEQERLFQVYLGSSIYEKHMIFTWSIGTKLLNPWWVRFLGKRHYDTSPESFCDLLWTFKYSGGSKLPGHAASNLLFSISPEAREKTITNCIERSTSDHRSLDRLNGYAIPDIGYLMERARMGKAFLPYRTYARFNLNPTITLADYLVMDQFDYNKDGVLTNPESEAPKTEIHQLTMQYGNPQNQGTLSVRKWLAMGVELGDRNEMVSLLLTLPEGVRAYFLRTIDTLARSTLTDLNGFALLVDALLDDSINNPSGRCISQNTLASEIIIWIIREHSVYYLSQMVPLLQHRGLLLKMLHPEKGAVRGAMPVKAYKKLERLSEKIGNGLYPNEFELHSPKIMQYSTLLRNWSSGKIDDSLAQMVRIIYEDEAGLDEVPVPPRP